VARSSHPPVLRRANGRTARSIVTTPLRCSAFAGRIVVVLIALFAVALLAGCGGSSSGTTATVVVTSGAAHATSPANSPAGSTTQTTPATGAAGKIPTTASTRPSSTATPSPAGSAPGSTKATSTTASNAHLLRRYAGNGNTQLGTIVLRTPSTLVWKAQRAPIQVFTAKGFILVNSTAPSGVTRLSQGTYRGVRVASHAGWSLELLRASAP
jgi:hypothetical protein